MIGLRALFSRGGETIRTAYVRREDGAWSSHPGTASIYVDSETRSLIVEAVDGSALAIYVDGAYKHAEHPLSGGAPAGGKVPAVAFWSEFDDVDARGELV